MLYAIVYHKVDAFRINNSIMLMINFPIKILQKKSSNHWKVFLKDTEAKLFVSQFLFTLTPHIFLPERFERQATNFLFVLVSLMSYANIP